MNIADLQKTVRAASEALKLAVERDPEMRRVYNRAQAVLALQTARAARTP